MPLIKITVDNVAYAVEPTMEKPKSWPYLSAQPSEQDFETYNRQRDEFESHCLSLPCFQLHESFQDLPDYSEVPGEKEKQVYDSGKGIWLKETALTKDPFNWAQTRIVIVPLETKNESI